MERAKMVEITRTSSKGQVVIPTDIRKKMGIKTGSLFFITSKNGMIVMKRLNAKISNADLKTLRNVEEAWKDIEDGRYKVYSKEAFSKELAKW
ncbi:MAG: AbrB/MazE/SpoVT family DNA-binding domain-containing protein [Candidatus Micrarchaeota archaeon]|nr:AbrB/MazE/SpoVT family DNA-binding domain-containing protein [Candidatus Micrarchaeota archaeon]MDE1848011.1 AbrB/MazE/SpoVT family DNA-binding domain-containing protein [Candidatus Micrarchaeota archaeon]MDE1864612.1 AbrB/MazE/SpoVT family DNA-binding domain-containing protein [Candidatus Micrarchaeota archaeon]